MEEEKKEIIDEYGFNEKHLYVNEDGTKTKFNPYGFDYLHRYKGKEAVLSDEYGFNFYGINKITGKVYDIHGFDRDGFYYEKDGKEYIKTDRKINNDHYDRDGYYYVLEGEEYVKTEYTTTPEGYDFEGKYHEDGVRNPKLLKEIKNKKEEEQRKRLDEETKKQEMIDERKRLLDEFSLKFDESGMCIKTGLPYDENYFLKNKTNVITNTNYDIRNFDCIGRCKDNAFSIYDRGGFRQDGTYRDTNEKYHNGYNAFGVDKDGKLRNGKTPEEIAIGKDYIKAIFEPTSTVNRVSFIKNFSIRKGYDDRASINKLELTLFIACEMYPSLKEELGKYLDLTSKQLDVYRNRLKQMENEKNANQETLEKYERIITSLEKRQKAVGYSGGER